MPSSTIFSLPFFRHTPAAISDICQIEEAFVNFIKGISGGDPSMSRRAYSLRIDKFVRDMKAAFRSLGHSVVKFECELTCFKISSDKLLMNDNLSITCTASSQSAFLDSMVRETR